MTLVVRTDGPPDGVVPAVRSIIVDVDPLLAIFSIKTMDQVVDESTALFRLVLALFTAFAVLALTLAITGTYGVVSYAAGARAREFAVRIALGASPRRVAGAVLRHGVALALVGLACGMAAGLGLAPLLKHLPVTMRPPDLLTLSAVAAIVSAVGLAACLLPAVRAARVDPMAVLRSE
jgi:ABC-type antimicrobial peptide transport system permease subunit